MSCDCWACPGRRRGSSSCGCGKRGVLVRVGERYYPAGAVTPPEEQLAVIQTYLREHGSGRRQDFLRLLNVSPAQGTQILRRLTARGELILTGRRYTLPKGK